ncbi:MAG TPA: 3-phosphoshikimate 1-carboxyvinyltransferase [Candidatus Brocadiia bacterium]|nr:3-phosphoshikimate 1-carboxyvinyltransferase [Candidatus Brocadiia bacterium]
MKFKCGQSRLAGKVAIPGSKSHTIRAVAISALAPGQSRIKAPLLSQDTLSAVACYKAVGAVIEDRGEEWLVTGVGAWPSVPENIIDVGNSGTTLNVIMGTCALIEKGLSVLTGDEQIRRRPSGALADSLNQLGASVRSTRGNAFPPYVVGGPIKGGEATVDAVSSQYLSSLLMCCPLADGDSAIRVTRLNEQPYVQMTLDWLKTQGIKVAHDGFSEFNIPGRQSYLPVNRRIPADFSSATFFLCAGAIGDNDVTVCGMDMNDSQGDRAVVDYLRAMGADVAVAGDEIRVRRGNLSGAEIDLNATPDALPMLAALACFARGETRLVNVPQARIKETDRIAVMRAELAKLGADVRELPDGLIVRESRLKSCKVNGHADHRIVMALAIAGTALAGETVIEQSEAAGVTFPTFAGLVRELDGTLEEIPD